MARPRMRVFSALIAGILILTACSGSQHKIAKVTAPITLAYAHEQEFSSYNNNTATQSLAANSVVLNQVLRGFWYNGPDGQTEPDTEFGTFERITSNPLTVRYTFNPKAQWSDGTPIDCSDAVLAWAANSGRWPTGRTDPVTGQKLTAFSSLRPGAWANVGAPKCADGDRSFTVTYDTVYADWESLFGPGTILPAHIVEKESGVSSVIAAVRSDNPKTMIKIGDIYNSLWVFRPGQYKSDLSPSAGPYRVAAWQAGQSITLKPNPRWWGAPPRASTIVIKFIPQDQQVAALRSGAVQVIDPQPTPEILAQLREGGRPVQVSSHDSFTWEHLDFNFGSEFKSKDLRTAFAKCIPRQQIVDNLIKPQNRNAQILESRFLLPFQPAYQAFTNLGGQAFNAVDIAGAKKILQARHKVGTTVRIAYQTPNPRRKAEVDLIRDFCGQAGFKVLDSGSDTFFGTALDRGDFDVALFAWTGSSLVTQSYATYMTAGAQNKGGYSNPQVDLLLKQLYSELNPTHQRQLMTQLDSILWADVATIPLFAFPALLATASNLQGVQYNPSSSDVTFNVDAWSLKH
jgi:peptide/nickel transport system substrate-binding protein